jgi:hypothetical protein
VDSHPPEETDVIGKLPLRYQVTLWAVGFVACAGAGAWLAFMTPVPLLWQYGAVVGALLAPALVALYSRGLAAGRPDTSPASRG